jgi:hypothetical protein
VSSEHVDASTNHIKQQNNDPSSSNLQDENTNQEHEIIEQIYNSYVNSL